MPSGVTVSVCKGRQKCGVSFVTRDLPRCTDERAGRESLLQPCRWVMDCHMPSLPGGVKVDGIPGLLPEVPVDTCSLPLFTASTVVKEIPGVREGQMS